MNDELVIYNLDQFKTDDNDTFIIGAFESFHLGHFQLYKKALEVGGRIILVLFSNDAGMPKFQNKIFMDNYARYSQLARLSFDSIIELDYNQVSNLDPLDFIQKLTQGKKCNIIAGTDFKFGKNQAMDLSGLQEFGDKNISIFPVDTLKVQNVKISTSMLKENVEFGKISFVNSLLVYSYAFSGMVANDNEVKVNEKLVNMHPGIYAAYLHIENIIFYAILHVNQEQKYFFKVIDVNQENSLINKKIWLEVEKEIRLIISNVDDYVQNIDIDNAKQIFASK
ncbi:hypothetical protein H9M94_02160 [Mycoplasma sp. Pen4]|uniref:FAD synthase n=1 Tax=Mycoplasma sp. Pen4 TaxID=640330 RepID=UPI001654322E|nr:hypothetical protein [Mycoplasma sp. Pen4]QNM93400.1 hypothetical protein H9M94_02160 [Mycoplasma sp. Pen4]